MTERLALIFWFGLSLTTQAADGKPALQFRKELDRGTATGEEVLAVLLDSDIYAATRDGYPDLRILDDRGTMVPYLLEPVAQRRTSQVRQPCASKVASLHVDEGKGLEIVLELDEKAPGATGATIRTPLADYERHIRVYGSRTGVDWAPLVSEGAIFDYSRFMDVRNRDVVLPANDYRQFKVVVENELDDRESPLRELIRGRGEGKKDEQVEITRVLRRPFRIDGVDLWRTIETDRASKVETRPYPTAGLRVDSDAKQKVSRVEITSRREPLTRLSVSTASRNFSRPATVLIPVHQGTRTDWVEVGHGTLSLIQFRAFRRAELRVDFPEQRQKHYQLVIENADNPPLEISEVEAEGTGYRLVFLGTEGRTYRVEYGSDTVEPPKYDTAVVLGSMQKGFQPVIVNLGPQVANPGYETLRGPLDILNSKVVLALAIVVMVLVLAWVLVRAGQRIKNLPPEEV
jgi:hypothetical protein